MPMPRKLSPTWIPGDLYPKSLFSEPRYRVFPLVDVPPLVEDPAKSSPHRALQVPGIVSSYPYPGGSTSTTPVQMRRQTHRDFHKNDSKWDRKKDHIVTLSRWSTWKVHGEPKDHERREWILPPFGALVSIEMHLPDFSSIPTHIRTSSRKNCESNGWVCWSRLLPNHW